MVCFPQFARLSAKFRPQVPPCKDATVNLCLLTRTRGLHVHLRSVDGLSPRVNYLMYPFSVHDILQGFSGPSDHLAARTKTTSCNKTWFPSTKKSYPSENPSAQKIVVKTMENIVVTVVQEVFRSSSRAPQFSRSRGSCCQRRELLVVKHQRTGSFTQVFPFCTIRKFCAHQILQGPFVQLQPLSSANEAPLLPCARTQSLTFFDLRLLIVLAVPRPSELGHGGLVSSQTNAAAITTQDSDCYSVLFMNNFNVFLLFHMGIKMRIALSDFPSALVAVYFSAVRPSLTLSWKRSSVKALRKSLWNH